MHPIWKSTHDVLAFMQVVQKYMRTIGQSSFHIHIKTLLIVQFPNQQQMRVSVRINIWQQPLFARCTDGITHILHSPSKKKRQSLFKKNELCFGTVKHFLSHQI